ncbi:MAG: VirB4 family type IV secretion system protein [Candidatus Humimicrobiaceae bacterium]
MLALIKDLLGIKSKGKKTIKGDFTLPIESINDLIECSDGIYKIVLKVSPVNGELLSYDSLEMISDSIQGALASFEGRIGIYIQSEIVDIDINILNIEKLERELNSEIKLVLLEEQKKHILSMAGRSRNVLNFYTVFEVKEDNFNSARELLNDTYQSFKTELESQGMYVDQLLQKDIKALLYRRMNPESSQSEPCREDWEIENILPENAKIYKDGRHIEIENHLYRFYSIIKYPSTVDKYRWLRKVFNTKGDINIAITLTPKNKATIMKELSKAVSELGAKALDSRKDESLRQKYQAESNSAKDMITELGNDNISLYDTNITIGISAPDIKDLNTLSSILRSKISSSYCQATELRYKGYDPFITTLPILAENKITKNYVWNLTTRDVASLIPYDSSELMEPAGVFIGENVISNGLVIIDTYNKIYNNPHECIIADSGSGKSFRIKTDAIRHIPYRDYIIMFDLENEFHYPWGKRYKFSPTSGIISNPFHIRNTVIDSDDEEDKTDVGTFLSTKVMDSIIFFKWILKDLTPYDEALLEEDIRDSYERKGITFKSSSLPGTFPTLDTLSEVMKSKISGNKTSSKAREARDNMLASLQPYITGAYNYMFNGQTNWDYDFFTVFDISGLPEAVTKPLYDILLKDTWQFCKADRKKTKRIYVDEAHQFADPDNPQTLKFLANSIKRGRKYGISFVTATQNLPDFLSIERYGQAIIDNSYFKLFFRLGETDIPVVKDLYGFSDQELSILKGSSSKREGAKGKGIFIAGSQRVVIQVRASKYELKIVDPIQYDEIYGNK